MAVYEIEYEGKKLQFRSFDANIAIMIHPSEDEKESYFFPMTYQEFMELASFLGFDATPHEYRKILSELP